jgi:hypothetical protein
VNWNVKAQAVKKERKRETNGAATKREMEMAKQENWKLEEPKSHV